MESKYDGFDFDRVGAKAYEDYNSPKLIIKTLATKVNMTHFTDNPNLKFLCNEDKEI